MATESPIRFMEASGKKWLQGNARNTIPNRSESAPPSIEGSFAAIENLMSLQNFGSNVSLLDRTSESAQFRADPAYFAYHSTNLDLKSRLSPPLNSLENQRLVRNIGSLGNNWRSKSLDTSIFGSVDLSECKLTTHEEESEEDRSPPQARDDGAERKSAYWSAQDTASSGQHKLLVDLLKEDHSLSSAHTYNKLSSFSHDPVEEAVDESDSSSLHDFSVSTSSAVVSNSNSSGLDRKEGTQPLYRRRTNTTNAYLEVEVPSSNVSESDVTRVISELKAISISSVPNLDIHKNERDPQYSHRSNMVPQQVLLHQRHAFEVPGARSQMISEGINDSNIGTNQFSYGLSNFSPAAYMSSVNPFYHNLHPSSGYFAQYGISGYAWNNTHLPPFSPGYPQNAIPMAFDGRAPSLMAQTSGFSTDAQHANKFYGHLGFSVGPSLTDPLNMHHFQHPSGDAYNHGFGGPSNPNSRMPGPTATGPYYFGNSPNTSILMHFPTSPIATQVLPASATGRTRFPGGKNEPRLHPGSVRNISIYSGWQGQRAPESFVNTKSNSFLEEVRSGKGRRFELVDIAGRIVEYSADQHGSRFIQQKLENCTVDEKASVFREVLPYASGLMTDVFGNYVIQKFFDYGSPEQRKELADKLEGHILPLSLQMYGCRVIQKALEVIELEQKIKLIHELDGHVTRCVRDQNGNHVIQKCIESIPTDKIGFIISAFRGQVATLSTHPYGCRVIQRVLEHCTDELQSQFIVDEILESTYMLAQDQYGNYVTQHVLGRGKPHERSKIISKLSAHVVQMSQHKFASNVVEKCLEHGDCEAQEIMIAEIIGHNEENENLLTMMKDQYANYVIQKILETCTDNQREMLLSRIGVHLNALKKYTYGKHIAARFEQLYGEEIQRFGA